MVLISHSKQVYLSFFQKSADIAACYFFCQLCLLTVHKIQALNCCKPTCSTCICNSFALSITQKIHKTVCPWVLMVATERQVPNFTDIMPVYINAWTKSGFRLLTQTLDKAQIESTKPCSAFVSQFGVH